MTFDEAREVFLSQKKDGLDPLMLKYDGQFYVTDRPAHLLKCKEVGHAEAMKLASEG